MDAFYDICQRRKPKVNASKSKAMVFETAEGEITDLTTPYRVRVLTGIGCEKKLGSERMEEVTEFKYLGSVLGKHGSM